MMDRMNRYSNATSKGLGAGTPMFAKGSCANMRTNPMVKDKTISANHTSAPAAVGNANERKPIINPSGTTTKPTLGTGPLIAHYFGHLSLAGFVSNPLIVPLVGFVVVPLGLMIGFLSLALPTAAGALVWFAEMVLSLIIGLVRMFAQLPLATIGVPAPNPSEV